MSTALLPSPVSSAPPEAPSSTKTCPRCGALLFSDMDVCYRCFHRFDTPPHPEPIGFDPEGLWTDPLFDAGESGEYSTSEPLDAPPFYEDPFAAEKRTPANLAYPPWEDSPLWGQDLSGECSKFYGQRDPGALWSENACAADVWRGADGSCAEGFPTHAALDEERAFLPCEYGGERPFSSEDAEVDEADETRDLTAISESVSYGLHLNWRGLEVTIPVPAQGLTLGRSSSCDVVLRSAAISRRHVQVVVEDGMVLVADLGSVNQALLDGKPVEVCEPWLPGSVLNLCGARFSLIMLDPRE